MLPSHNAPLTCAFDKDADYHGDTASDVPVMIEELILGNQIENNSPAEKIFIPGTSQEKQAKKRKNATTSIYDKVEMLTKTQVKKQKNKDEFLHKINQTKLERHEIELKIKREELEAQRLKFLRDENESQLRREVLAVELENARVILKRNKIELDKIENKN
ncbi:hypothetical protein C0J52_18810 [Blattella germanica]|nr:hypothetical protein C0J52_18810 [Blattella germanica]